MTRRGLWAQALGLALGLWTGGAWADGLTGPGLISGGTIVNPTFSGPIYGLNQTPFTIVGGGSGYAAGDYITLTCAGCTATTQPTIVVSQISGGGVVTGTQVRQSGAFTKSPTTVLTFTQVSSSGAGTGASFTGQLGPVASIINMPVLGSGGGSGNGNLFLMGGEGPCSSMLADESTHYGDKAGLGLGIGHNDSNVIMGHNAAGNGVVTCLAQMNGSVVMGADAVRNIQGNNSGIHAFGTSALRNVNGASTDLGIGVNALVNCTTCNNTLAILASAPTLTTGAYNMYFGPASDALSSSESNTIRFTGQFGDVLTASGTNNPGGTTWTFPGHVAMTGNFGVGTYSLDVQHGMQVAGMLSSNGTTSLGCCLITQTGLGNVNHMNGPTDNDWNIVGGVAAQSTSAVTGFGINFVGSNAVAGTSVVGAAQGGSITFTGGNAARLTSGGASGGGFTFTGGTGLSGNNGGGFSFTGGPNNSPSGGVGGSFIALTGGAADSAIGNGGSNSGSVSIQSGIGGSVSTASTGRVAGNSGAIVFGSLAGGAHTGANAGTAGNSGAITIGTGSGGAATGGSGTRTGGNSGALTLATGAAGSGSSANGTVGSISLSPGGTAAVTAASGQITTMTGPTQYTGAVKSTPSTGGTVTYAATQRLAIIVPAGTLATLTITLPACAAGNDGDERSWLTSQILTSITVGASSGSVVGGVTTAAVGSGHSYHCYGADTAWYQMD